MIHRKLLIATAVIASVAGTACSDTTAPKELAPGAVSSASSQRSGALHVTKDCSLYFGRAGDTCTITSSSVKAIEVGTRIIYASDAVGTFLDTDVVLDPPGPGNNKAFGHCTLSLATGVGQCSLSGGTGKFTWVQASVAVSYLGGPNFAWEGTYSFSPRD
jgi:hypothetical protein